MRKSESPYLKTDEELEQEELLKDHLQTLKDLEDEQTGDVEDYEQPLFI